MNKDDGFYVIGRGITVEPDPGGIRITVATKTDVYIDRQQARNRFVEVMS